MERLNRLAIDRPGGRWPQGREPLHAGDCLELGVAEGCWVPARLEWLPCSESRVGAFSLGLPDDLEPALTLLPGARLRTLGGS